MSGRFEMTSTFDVPIGQVFERSLDVDFHQQSMAASGEEIVGGVSSGLMGLGDTVTWRAKHFGIWWRMTSIISEFDAPTYFVDQQLKGPFKRFRHEHHFAEGPNGSTTMRDVIEYAAPAGPLGRVVERLVLDRHLQALITLRNDELRRALQ